MLKAAAVMTVVFALGACAGPDKGGSGGTPPPPTRSPVSPAAYRATLLAATAPVDAALTKLAKAGSYKGLSGRITDVENAATQAATTLERQVPPPAVAAEHAKLAAALRQFGGDLNALGDDVSGKDLCTASAARAELGRADGTAALRDAAAALVAKAPDYRTSLELPAAQQGSGHRLANGYFVRSGSRGGRGTLTIDNGSEADAVITLAKGKRPVISVYVRTRNTR